MTTIRPTRSWRRTSVAVIAALSLVTAACGGSDDSSATTGAESSAASTDATSTDATSADSAGSDTTAGDDMTADTTEPSASGSTMAEAATGDPITVGIVTSTSGALQSYGQQYLDGLNAGIAYATDGTNAVNGHPIELEIKDDGGDPETAISQATELVGNGATIIAGTVVSGVAVQMASFAEENNILYISGPAATDAITGVNKNTFRSGRQSFQDVATAASLIEGDSGKVVVFAQDTEFGSANVSAVEAVLGARGFDVSGILVPATETEFTSYADQLNQAEPDLVFVAWAGDTSGAMWQALGQQKVFENSTVTTGLADTATWPFYGDDPSAIKFLNHYNVGAPDNDVNTYMVDNVENADLFTPDGFVAGQMIVQALSNAEADDVDGMISALEGWEFDAPKGAQTVRASDHAMLQPMFTVSLAADGSGGFEATTLSTLDPADTAPTEN